MALLEFEDDKQIAVSRDKALAWLKNAQAGKSTEWYATGLLLAARLGQAEKFRDQLLARQHADGGWGWLADDASDAFGTGLAIYALSAGGAPGAEKSIEQAQQFLIETQRDDGSWAVNSTKEKNKDKVAPTSNYWGTAWATIGLIYTLRD